MDWKKGGCHCGAVAFEVLAPDAVETDKATMEIEAVDNGTIGKLLVAEETENVPVNQPIALRLEDGEGASSFETRPSAAPQDEELSPHPEKGAQAPVSKGEPRKSFPPRQRPSM